MVGASLCVTPVPAAAQAGDNAELPLPPNAPPPGSGIPDFNGVWSVPYTPNLERPFGGAPPFTPFGKESYDEGNKLTIDTVGISARSWLDTAGHQHSDKLHLTEVWEKTGPDRFRWTVTYDDPVYYAKPWSITLEGKREKYDIMEMICTDNNRDVPHYITTPPKK